MNVNPGELPLVALVALVLGVAACDVGDPNPAEPAEPTMARLAMSTDASADTALPAEPGGAVDGDEIPPGEYGFDEIKAQLIAADPDFARALASISAGPPPGETVPARVEAPKHRPCVLPAPPPHDATSPVSYVPPDWEREVDVFARLAALPPHDLVTLEVVRDALAALVASEHPAASDEETDVP